MIRQLSTISSTVLLLSAGTPVLADLYGFARITANATTDVASQLLVNVTDAGSGQVSFNFTNNVGIPASITAIYFDDVAGLLAGIAALNPSAGVSFSVDGSPPNLPAGNTVGFSSDFRATSNPPTSFNGINAATESLEIVVNLSGASTFADTINALNTGSLVLGLHVQAIGTGGQSDSFISTPPNGTVIPAPGASVLALIGLAIIGRYRPRWSCGG